MHLVVVAPRCWPDPHPAATLTWHLARALGGHGVGLTAVGWKSWPGEPDRTAVGTANFVRLLRPQGLFAALRARREMAVRLRQLLPGCDGALVVHAGGEAQVAFDLAAHHQLPAAAWLDRLPLQRAHRGPHARPFGKSPLPRHVAVLCSGPQAEQFCRRLSQCGSVHRVPKGVPPPGGETELSPAEARGRLARCWPHVPLAGARHLVLLGPAGAARKHRDWLRRLADCLGRRFAGHVWLVVLAGTEDPAPYRWHLPGAAPVLWLPPFHDWSDLFRAADACLWLPDGTEVPYFALYAWAAGRLLLAPQVPETAFLLGRDRYGLRLPWQPVQRWCEQLAEAFATPDRFGRLLHMARNRAETQFTYQAMTQAVLRALGLSLAEHGKSLVG